MFAKPLLPFDASVCAGNVCSDQNEVIYMGNYQHWGVVQPGNVLEPNNQLPPEYCAGSNLSMGIATYDKKGVVYDGAGGWADRRCSERYVFICEVQREYCAHSAARACIGATAKRALSFLRLCKQVIIMSCSRFKAQSGACHGRMLSGYWCCHSSFTLLGPGHRRPAQQPEDPSSALVLTQHTQQGRLLTAPVRTMFLS
jgi:hypothetical protein